MAVGEGTAGAKVTKIVVSSDDGKTWKDAKIVKSENKDPNKKVFSWVHWECDVKVDSPT